MTKKALSYVLIFTIAIVSIIQPQVFANPQAPVRIFRVDEVYYVLGQNPVTNNPILRPTVTLSWEDPTSWAPGYNGGEVHVPDFYEVIVYNRTLSQQQTFRFDKGSEIYNNKRVNLHNEMNLDTGSLYEFTIQPRHYHYVERNGEIVREFAPQESSPVKAFAITDLNVELVPSEDEITIIWDDVTLQNLDYRIAYAVGDYSTQSKEALLNNKEGEITLKSSSPGVTTFYDPVARRNRLQYTISQNIYPGQIYSVIVEPTMDYLDGYAVQRNRNFPNAFTCSTNIDLLVTEDGDYVRLDWNIPPSFKVGQAQDEYELVEARILEYINGQARNVVIFDNKAANMEYYKVPKPSTEAQYQILLKYEAVGATNKKPIEPQSRRVPYVPSELKIRPTQPEVPKPISQRILTELRDTHTNTELKAIIEKDHLLPGDVFTGGVFDLLNSGRTFQVNRNQNSIQFVFTPFTRKDISPSSSTYGQTITDTNVYYDIYVTRNLNDLASAIKVVNRLQINPTDTNRVIRSGTNDILGYRVNLNQYYNSNYSTLQPIIPNQLYYIKIVAIKDWGTEEVRSEPNIIPIYFDYDGNIYSPPTIEKPPLKVREDETSTTSVTFEWKENWWEVVAKDTTSYPVLADWATEVWVDSEGNISTEPLENSRYYPIYQNDYEAERLKQRLIELGDTEFDYILREIDLGKDTFGVSDVKYKFHKIPYNQVKQRIDAVSKINPDYTLNDYIVELLDRDKEGSQPISWKEIQPSRDLDDNRLLFYKENGLLPNTQYLFLLYPYRVDLTGEVLNAHFPTPIIVATDSEGSIISPDPTVPNIYVSNYTDISATVTWKYNTDFRYELRYGTTEDITKAEAVPIVLPANPNDPRYPTSGSYYEQLVKDLFPNTEYYFWIRAIQPNTGKVSAWSNPAIITTRDVMPPLPPRGIGLASLESLKPFDYRQNQGETFLTLEWLLDPDDRPDQYANARIKKRYVYIVEIANNPNFIDPLYVELSDGQNDILPPNVEKLKKNLIKINELIPNRRYYFRLKTKVIIEGNQNQLLTRESTFYSPTISLLTLPSSKEYDGHGSDGIIILPYDYYETIYNQNTQQLIYRFRYDGQDQEGEFDQFMAEKLINTLIRDNVYTYTISIKDFENKPITKRQVEIPYRLWAAFRDYKIDVKIETDKTTLLIPSDSINSYLTQQVNQHGAQPSIRISIDDKPTSLAIGQTSAHSLLPVLMPQQIGMQVVTDKGHINISKVDTPMSLSLKTINRYSVYNKPIELAMWNQSKYAWDIQPATYDAYKGELNAKTNDLGLYYSYMTQYNVPEPVTNHWALPVKENVLSQINLLNLTNNLNSSVSKREYLNILGGLIEGKKTMDIQGNISDTMRSNLTKSKLLISEGALTNPLSRQEAIYMTVKALEVIQGRGLTPTTTSLNTVNQNNSISSNYRREIAIAYDQGIISNLNQVRPSDTLNYGEMFVLLNQLLALK